MRTSRARRGTPTPIEQRLAWGVLISTGLVGVGLTFGGLWSTRLSLVMIVAGALVALGLHRRGSARAMTELAVRQQLVVAQQASQELAARAGLLSTIRLLRDTNAVRVQEYREQIADLTSEVGDLRARLASLELQLADNREGFEAQILTWPGIAPQGCNLRQVN